MLRPEDHRDPVDRGFEDVVNSLPETSTHICHLSRSVEDKEDADAVDDDDLFPRVLIQRGKPDGPDISRQAALEILEVFQGRFMRDDHQEEIPDLLFQGEEPGEEDFFVFRPRASRDKNALPF